jgi:hypothetical protein
MNLGTGYDKIRFLICRETLLAIDQDERSMVFWVRFGPGGQRENRPKPLLSSWLFLADWAGLEISFPAIFT